LPKINLNPAPQDRNIFNASFEILAGEGLFINTDSNIGLSLSRKTSTCFQLFISNKDGSERYHAHYNYYYDMDWPKVLAQFTSKDLTVKLVGGAVCSSAQKADRSFECLFKHLLELKTDYKLTFDQQAIFLSYRNTKYLDKVANDIAIGRDGVFYDIQDIDLEVHHSIKGERGFRELEAEFRHCLSAPSYTDRVERERLLQIKNGYIPIHPFKPDTFSLFLAKNVDLEKEYLKPLLDARFPEILVCINPQALEAKTNTEKEHKAFFKALAQYKPRPNFSIRHWDSEMKPYLDF
jgi:hypothetical protein